MNKIFLLITFLTLLLLGPVALHGQSLSGRVVSNAGQPLAGAAVTVMPGQITTVTDANGAFRFDLIEKGKYSLTISFVGFKTLTKSLSFKPEPLVFGDIVMQVDEGQYRSSL